MMRLICLFLLLFVQAWAQDIEARIRIQHLEEDQKKILVALDKIEASNQRILDKYEKILEGNGKPGLKEQVHLNTTFREDMVQFLWILISAFAAQLGSTIFIVFKTVSITRKLKGG